MADFGEWGTVSFAIPDFLENIRDAVNDFAELLITFMEIANLVLEFSKSFVKAFLDPMVVLIEAILAEIQGLMDDLRQIGIYITGDWALLGWPPEDLRGGFASYERRMIARLTDRTDPTRPDVSSQTNVLGFFAYLSVDPSDFEQLARFIVNIIRMFGLSFFPDTSRLPTPVIREVNYGNEALGAGTNFNFTAIGDALKRDDGTPPQKARVTWVTQPPSEKHPFNPFPQLGPSGYIVTVSTLETGIQLKYARPKANTEKKPAQGDESNKAQPREYGSVVGKDLRPLVLHGGAEMLALKDTRFVYNDNMQDGIPKDGACQVFGMLDPATNEIIPLEDLGPRVTALGTPGDKRGSEFYLQRTFLVESGTALAQWFAGEYNATLDIEDMPLPATWSKQPDGTFTLTPGNGPATHYYIRAWSVGKQIAAQGALPQWDFESEGASTNAETAGAPFIVQMKSGDEAVSMPSAPRKITFANANTAEYLQSLRAALLVLVLTRPDLPLLDDIEAAKGQEVADQYREGNWVGQGFALTPTGLEVAKALVGILQPNRHDMAKPGQNAQDWCKRLYFRIEQLAMDIYERTGPMPDLEKAIVEQSAELRALTWTGLIESSLATGTASLDAGAFTDRVWGSDPEPNIFEALNPSSNMMQQGEFGLAPNVYSADMDPAEVDQLFFVDEAISGREDFVIWDGGSLDPSYSESDPDKVQALLKSSPASLRAIYERFVQEDGSLLVPEAWRTMLEKVKSTGRKVSSGDFTPVFYFDKTQLLALDPSSSAADVKGQVFYTRGMVRAYEQEGEAAGLLLSQTSLVLNAATAAMTRAPEDGEWIAIRLFDALPDLEEFLSMIDNWVRSVAEAVASMADAVLKYIEFVQAQIVELQQLIRRINAFIQSLLQFSFSLPQFSGLMLLSNGTDGLMADLVAAENKPSDSPLSYGGGVALVIPFGPSFIIDLIDVASNRNRAGDLGTSLFDPTSATVITRPPGAIGVEGVQPTPTVEDDADVL